ncbi:hypothetical protein D9756_011444 [Leucocoprinus leucothites]|uniref:CDC20/Fizzy WD40 domain-containing protein n=1 Tax=Leucocoprinus leucothites TaxID=201217 RepID=A0A8H5CLU8_9AGAR|nr:hypothetical protein D9756_011444 [Leucoagaricus leucothites]
MPPPKTPSNRIRSRSEAKTPLTPSIISGLSNVSLAASPTKKSSRAGGGGGGLKSTPSNTTANPFLTTTQASRSRPSSRAASPQPVGVIRKGGVESRLDVITRDYVPPPKQELKRSRSTPATNRVGIDHRDRFITHRESNTDLAQLASTLDHLSLSSTSNPTSTTSTTNTSTTTSQPTTTQASPGHTARLAAATGLPINRRILGYHEQPPLPSSSHDLTLAQQREYAKPLYAQRPGALPSSTGTTTSKARKIPTQPERVLDAPGMVDDFYLNLLSWSCQNAVAVALETATYVWKADTGTVAQLGEGAPEGSYVSSVDFSNDGAFLGIGLSTGEVELWDTESGQKLRSMTGHNGQVAVLSWNQHILSSGCADGSIWHHDVRVARHKVMELLGHGGEVCGLRWRQDGELLASGGNDNVINIWDGRIGDVGGDARGSAKWTKRNHTAAVKALAWCPWQPSLLASGGGTNDSTINIWNSTTGARLHTLRTPSQITSLHFSPHRKELLSTHGYPTNSIMIHAYPSMERVAEIRDAHESRVLFSCVGPAGDVVCTGAGDENLKFWRVWEVSGEGGATVGKRRGVKGVGVEEGGGRVNSTREGILSIR